MRYLRRHLRILTVASLAVQATWLPALVPQDCCARHCVPAVVADDCHADAMFSGHDVECAGADHGTGHHDDGDDCALQAACAGPLAALNVLLAQTGIAVDRLVWLPSPAVQPSPATPRQRTIDYGAPPDTPPPRA
jgi:hypothetical protein